ncbi:MAG: hypothetical protein ABUU24_08730, partial [Variovorax sp.]
RFSRALRKGVEWYNANRSSPEALQAISEFTKLPVSTLQEMKLPPMALDVDIAQLRKTAELMREHGLLTSTPDLEKFVNRAVLAH